MKNKERHNASLRALRRLKNKYKDEYKVLYEQELAVVNLKAKGYVIDKDKLKDEVQTIIAERLMNKEYLGALMQEVGTIHE